MDPSLGCRKRLENRTKPGITLQLASLYLVEYRGADGNPTGIVRLVYLSPRPVKPTISLRGSGRSTSRELNAEWAGNILFLAKSEARLQDEK
jgi:hypothetical protein